MDEVTQQNSALVEENAATAKTLEQQAQAMDERVASSRSDDARADDEARASCRSSDPPRRGRRKEASGGRREAQTLRLGRRSLPRPLRRSVPPRSAPKRGVRGPCRPRFRNRVHADPEWKEF